MPRQYCAVLYLILAIVPSRSAAGNCGFIVSSSALCFSQAGSLPKRILGQEQGLFMLSESSAMHTQDPTSLKFSSSSTHRNSKAEDTIHVDKVSRDDNPTHSSASNTTHQFSNDDLGNSKKEDSSNSNRNLYGVLGASPSHSKEQLKQRYIALAKQCHPDAVRGSNHSDHLDFSEIAAAYRVLSDPKQRRRYDRMLQAEAFSRELQKFASDVTDKAAPQVRDIFDTVAVPFLRRTTATTLASIQAVAKDLSRQKVASSDGPANGDFGTALLSALHAAQKAGQIVDNLEQLEKSEVLEQKVLSQIEQASRIKSELNEVTAKRLRANLRIPNTVMSAADALNVARFLNISDSLSLLERARLQHPLFERIQQLESIERAFSEKKVEIEVAESDYSGKHKELAHARSRKVLALQAVQKAREALRRAEKQVADTESLVEDATTSLTIAEAKLDKLELEKARLAKKVRRQQHAVKDALLKKDKAIASKAFSGGDAEDETAELLQAKENELLKRYKELEVAAARLQSKANELRKRAKHLNDSNLEP